MRNIEPTARSKMAARGPQNGRRGLERGPTLGYWALPSSFAKKVFDPSTPSMRKGRDGGEKKKGKQAVAELCQAQA